ncbi:MAG TPA: hypothetical protein VK539_12440 [Myxococcaceae bacterium]|nr:hypothetical protein [Myxococcaceae bacterium]
MTPWLTLSLGLLLGQTPPGSTSLPPDADVQDPAALEFREAWERALQQAEATDEGQGQADDTVTTPAGDAAATDSDAPGIGGAGSDTGQETTAVPRSNAPAPQSSAPAPEGNEAAAPAPNMRQEIDQLRTQVQSLQTQLEAQQQEATARTGLVEQEVLGMQERAQEQERQRTQRLALLEDAGVWVLAVDQALSVGELDIGDAVDAADLALSEALQNATDTGNGQTVLLVENVRTRLAFALEAAGRRSVEEARSALFLANLELREARRHTLDRADTSVLTP